MTGSYKTLRTLKDKAQVKLETEKEEGARERRSRRGAGRRR